MPNEDNQQPYAENNPRNLPARLPSSSLILHRTQLAVGLLRDVVQESSAEYWYERGKKASATENWAKAAYAFERCLACDNKWWRADLQLAVCLLLEEPDAVAVAMLQAYQKPYRYWSEFVSELPEPIWYKLRAYPKNKRE